MKQMPLCFLALVRFFPQRLCKCAANGERAVEVAAHLQQFYGIRLVKMLSPSITPPKQAVICIERMQPF